MMANAIQHAVYADAEDSIPSADPKDAGTHRLLTSAKASVNTTTQKTIWPRNRPRLGVGPSGDLPQ